MTATGFQHTGRGLLAAAGVLVLAAGLGAEEAVIEGVSQANVNVRGINEKGVMGIVSYLVNPKDTAVEILGIKLAHMDLQKGWKVDIAWTRPPGSSRDSTARLATQITVQCDWLEGVLAAKPAEQGAVVQTTIENKPATLNVRFISGTEMVNLGDKKPKDLGKGAAVKIQVISGSQPPIAMTFESVGPAGPEGGHTPPPASAPAASQPASQPVIALTGKIETLEGNRLTLYMLRGVSGSTAPILLTANTVVVLEGKPGKQGDLKAGQWVKVTREDPGDKAVRIESAAAPWEEYLVPQPTAGGSPTTAPAK